MKYNVKDQFTRFFHFNHVIFIQYTDLGHIWPFLQRQVNFEDVFGEPDGVRSMSTYGAQNVSMTSSSAPAVLTAVSSGPVREEAGR